MASSKGSMVKNNDVLLDDDWDTNSVNNIKPSHDFIELMALWTKLYGGEPRGICDHIFSSISMQYAVQISPSNYIPVEMALVHYSWNSGTLNSKFYRLIKPDGNGMPMPQDFMAEARDHSEATHKIEFGGGPDATANYAQILTELYEHLSWIDKKAFVFCLEKEFEIVQSGLRYLEKYAKNLAIKPITILKVDELFMALHWWARHGRKKMYPLPEQISHEKERIKACLMRSCYDFTSSIRCAFHQKRDSGFCALSKASLTWMHMDDYLKCIYPPKVQTRDAKAILADKTTTATANPGAKTTTHIFAESSNATSVSAKAATTSYEASTTTSSPACSSPVPWEPLDPCAIVGAVTLSRGSVDFRTVRLVFHDERCVGLRFLQSVEAILDRLSYRPRRSTLHIREDVIFVFVEFQMFEFAHFVVYNINLFADELRRKYNDLIWTPNAITTNFDHWNTTLRIEAGECRSVFAYCGKASTLRRNLQRERKESRNAMATNIRSGSVTTHFHNSSYSHLNE